MMGLGLSASAIAGTGRDHPRDPGDLKRCVDYCRGRYSTESLRRRMDGRSKEWDRLLPWWDYLTALLQEEIDTRTDGMAPRTYATMKRVIAGGSECWQCEGTGRGKDCPKCGGTGLRCGDRCRADGCYRGADLCPRCHGRGYTGGDQ